MPVWWEIGVNVPPLFVSLRGEEVIIELPNRYLIFLQ